MNILRGWLVLALVASLVLAMGLVGVASASRVVHWVTVGGPDLCEARGQPLGCDANFSLVAFLMADGSVRGQYHDQFSHLTFPGLGGSGIHVAVDCLYVDGNQAWVSGEITQSRAPGVVGLDALTMVEDNGRTANDAPDQISFSSISPGVVDCTAAPAVPLLPVPQGQVRVQ